MIEICLKDSSFDIAFQYIQPFVKTFSTNAFGIFKRWRKSTVIPQFSYRDRKASANEVLHKILNHRHEARRLPSLKIVKTN